MVYRVKYNKRVLKKLAKMDKDQARMIYSWIDKNLMNTTNPRLHGKALKGKLSEYWRYRVGKYRIIADIVDDQILIKLLDVGHRSEIYKRV